MNPFYISKTCIKIANSEVLFEKYRMALNWDKYDIEVRDDDTIKRNRIFLDFMQQKFSCLNGLYMDETFILIYTIKKCQLRKQISAEVERLNRGKKDRNKKKEGISKPSPKKGCFVNKKTRTSQATSNTSNSDINMDIPQCIEAISSE